jgi:hypothetical protein
MHIRQSLPSYLELNPEWSFSHQILLALEPVEPHLQRLQQIRRELAREKPLARPSEPMRTSYSSGYSTVRPPSLYKPRPDRARRPAEPPATSSTAEAVDGQ